MLKQVQHDNTKHMTQIGASKIIETPNLNLDNSNPLEEKVIQNPDIKTLDYTPQSQICSTIETVAPVQLLYDMNKSIGKIDREVRGVDAYVMEKLGYENLIELCEALSAEQVDAVAVAIYQIEKKNQALIVGDMTGVGKGRIAGAMMRYAKLQGKVPIFFTEKPNLFSDIYRDIIAIGSDRGIVQEYLTGEKEKEKKATLAEIKDKINEDIDNGDFDLGYDTERLFKKEYKKETNDCIEEYRELYFPSSTIIVPVYKRNDSYEKDFKRVDKKFVPFILNNRGSKTNVQDTNGNIIYKATDSNTKKKIYEAKSLPKEFDCILLTYSQIRNPNKGKDKSDFIKEMAVGNIIIMDESHNASGTSNTGKYLSALLGTSHGATFLSATYAKRPDNMPIYAKKTAMIDTGLSDEGLISAFQAGGVALQEIVASDLVAEGQMVRREKSYEGIDVNYVYLDESLEDSTNPFYKPEFNLKEQHLAISDKITSIIRKIISFQRDYVNPVIETMDEQFSAQQERVEVANQLQDAGINNPPIFNGIFNLINQLILSIKAESIAEWAIMRMKQGKKPVIALANTMESFLDYLLESEGSSTIKTDFSIVLKRRLLSTMKYTKKYADGTNEVEYLEPESMSSVFQDVYFSLLEEIEKATIGISVSPIDIILNRIQDAGFSIAEVTGRNKYVDFTSKNKGVIKNRIRPNNSDLFRKFNNNEIDCLLINQSGATGASAHAIKTSGARIVNYNKDGKAIIPTNLDNKHEVKQRVMIVLQAELNVNTEVQKRGRVNRTGQLFPPIYDYIISAIPAEMRLMMMLQKKLKSLDANTTSNQKQSTSIIDVVDFLNVYGNDVIIEYMKLNPHINELTGNILRFDNNQPTEESYTVEDRAHRVSGRIAILSSEMQEDFYNTMVSDYNSFVQKKRDAGEDNMQVERVDLKAETKDTNVVEPPNVEGARSIFSEGVYLETAQCQNLRKPYEKFEVEAQIERSLTITEADGTEIKFTPEQLMEHHLSRMNKFFETRLSSELEDAEFMRTRDLKAIKETKTYESLENEKERKQYITEKTEKIEEDYNLRISKINTSVENNRRIIESNIKFFYAKRKIDYPLQNFETEGNRADGICLGVKIDYKAKNPFAPSAIEVRFILANSLRTVRFKLTDVFLANIKEATREYSHTNNMESSIYQTNNLLDEWDEITRDSRSDKVTKHIVTGNLLKALGNSEFQTGKLITFTTNKEGVLRKGIMMPDIFKPKAYDVTLPIAKALPIIMNLGSGNMMYIKNSTISITKAGNYWKILAGARGSQNIYKDLEITKFAIDDRWEKRENWTLSFEKPQMKDMLQYLDDTYHFKIGVAGNIFESYKDRLGYGDAIEQDMKQAQQGEQEIILELNDDYNKKHPQEQDEERIEQIDDEQEFTTLKHANDEMQMKFKMVKLYLAIKKAQKAREAEKMQKGGTIGELATHERKKLQYLLNKHILGNASIWDLRELADLSDMLKTKLYFTDWGQKQFDYLINKHNLGNMKDYEYKTFADVLNTEFGDKLFKN